MIKLNLKEALAQIPQNPFGQREAMGMGNWLYHNYKKVKQYTITDIVSRTTYCIFEWPHGIEAAPAPQVEAPTLLWRDFEIKIDESGQVVYRNIETETWYYTGVRL